MSKLNDKSNFQQWSQPDGDEKIIALLRKTENLTRLYSLQLSGWTAKYGMGCSFIFPAVGQAGSSSLWNRAKFVASLLCPDRNMNRVTLPAWICVCAI
ncbi:hypothetical protein OUZ56_005734 [Daphnia magna]|uniref:Uncharacterized protein n=1 Tax=Daphnia magna TaxID=35525 RepID=A0ABQ9YTN1_9CRUS|nr:hypothetical protein OUZ56_005734 [Daphnia magna]